MRQKRGIFQLAAGVEPNTMLRKNATRETTATVTAVIRAITNNPFQCITNRAFSMFSALKNRAPARAAEPTHG